MKVSLAMGLVLGVASAIETAAPVAAQTCEGDCNADSSVAIDEIILAIRLALGDAPIECTTDLVGLCGACTGLNQCQRGLACFPCSDDCSGNTSRCGLPVTFVACEDGIF